MKLLSLDSATTACSAALWGDGAVLAHRHRAMMRGHAEALVPMIEEVVGEARVGYQELDHVVATVGPGAFTGLRIGLATARGIALAAGVPVGGVTTLEVLAHATGGDERAGRTVVVVIETKRADLYLQAFDPALTPLTEPAAHLPEAAARRLPVGPLLFAGDGSARLAATLADRDVRYTRAPGAPDAAEVAALAARRLAAGGALLVPTPLYLRPPDAAKPRTPGGLRP